MAKLIYFYKILRCSQPWLQLLLWTFFTHDDKMRFLTKRFVPDHQFKFQKKSIHGVERSCALKWVEKYPFLAYSARHHSFFCVPCVLSLTPEKRTNHFTKTPGFFQWNKIKELVEKHTKTQTHEDCVESLDGLKNSRDPETHQNVATMLDSSRLAKIQTNRSILRPVIRVNLLYNIK